MGIVESNDFHDDVVQYHCSTSITPLGWDLGCGVIFKLKEKFSIL